MYGLPPKFDVSPFLGTVLEQICFSVNNVSFAFGHDILVTVDLSFLELLPGMDRSWTKIRIPPRGWNGTALLGEAVIGAESSKDGTITIGFENGGGLRFCEEAVPYESYIIRIGNVETRV